MLEKRILPQMKWLKKIINNYPSEILSDEEKDLLELAISDFIELIIELIILSSVFTIIGVVIIFVVLLLGIII